MDSNGGQDSPLSTSASITGILTFLVAIAAAAYARITYLRNSDDEYFRVKTSLSWYKTESAWLADLLGALDARYSSSDSDNGLLRGRQTEYQMCRFVMDDLLKLEQRLLDLVSEIEARAAMVVDERTGASWTLVPRSWRQDGRRSVAVAWLAVRTKAMELVRQREALTARVQFLQISMISSRIGDLESRMRLHEMGLEKSWKMNGHG